MCAWWIGDLLRNWLLSERVVGRKTSSWRHGWVYEQALKSESVYEQSAASCLTPQSRSTFARHMLCLSPADGYGPLRGVHQHDTVMDQTGQMRTTHTLTPHPSGLLRHGTDSPSLCCYELHCTWSGLSTVCFKCALVKDFNVCMFSINKVNNNKNNNFLRHNWPSRTNKNAAE